MPPKKTAQAGPSTKKRRSARQSKAPQDNVPDVYYDMLAEATASPLENSPRPMKRRKVTPQPEDLSAQDHESLFGSDEPDATSRPPQMVYDDFAESDADDVEFEDVDIDALDTDQNQERSVEKSLTIDLSKPIGSPKQNITRRSIASFAERKLRLDVHKAHLVLLLLALYNRNRWCESDEIQSILKPLISRKTISLLHVDESKSQAQRSHSFNVAIEEICTLWRTTFTITARGMRRAHWRDDVDLEREFDLAEDLIDFSDFKTAAQTHRGSRDLGAQLFCALLRSLAVDARLVCSLQILPFSAVAKGTTPEKPKPAYAFAPPQSYSSDSATTRRKKLVDSPYPVWWVEVFSPASSNWIPLDPLVRNTINKPKTGFEPPASDQLNNMSYVIAFEDDGSARDVTRRYTQWFNAKTRRVRVESTRGGEKWWTKTLSVFRKPFSELRDEIEDAELTRRAQNEGMPKNVQDFKGHPVYVLERHLRMNEVIEPKREVGKVAIGGGAKGQKMETVYRRRDVHVCRTADAWYRRGRDVTKGVVPLKRVVPRRPKVEHAMSSDEEQMEDTAALYAEYQTDVYEPPPVEHGKIPKNAYGNLDVYVSSMIPAGAIHVQHPSAAKAAQVLGIDYADAVTGFDFKGRQGTAVINGAVVPAEMRLAVVSVVLGLQAQASDEVEAERSRILLGLWKKWLAALSIRERIQQEYGDQEEDEMEVGRDLESDEDSPYHDDDDNFGGGFLPDEDGDVAKEKEITKVQLPPMSAKQVAALLPPEPVYQEVVVIESPHKLPQLPLKQSDVAEDVSADDGDQGGGFIIDHDENDEPGGFMLKNSGDEAGGFLVEEEQEPGGFIAEEPDEQFGHKSVKMDIDTPDAGEGGFLPEPAIVETPTDTPKAKAPPLSALMATPGPKPTLADGAFIPKASLDTPMHEPDDADAANPTSETAAGDSPPPKQHIDTDDANEAVDARSETSLLSHDPEDDDAEPEWLEDNLI